MNVLVVVFISMFWLRLTVSLVVLAEAGVPKPGVAVSLRRRTGVSPGPTSTSHISGSTGHIPQVIKVIYLR